MSDTETGISHPPPSRRSSRIARGLHIIENKNIQKNGNRDLDPPPPQMVYLRIKRRFVCHFAAATAAQPNPLPIQPANNTAGNLNVIVANLPDLQPFAGNTVDWLIKIARLIFEPLGMGTLRTFTTGTVEAWLDSDTDATWRVVENGEVLQPVIYEFFPSHLPISLTKQSLRQARSVTVSTSEPDATAFRGALLQRHGKCVISGDDAHSMLVASHVIPRRLGDSGVNSIIQRFAPPGSLTVTGRYDPIIGLPLLLNLDGLMDRYDMGFWSDGPNEYVIHCFIDKPRNTDGGALYPHQRALHGHRITLTTCDDLLPLPPVAVFNWHYTQCVLKKFSAGAYQAIDNIHYFVFPFFTRDDNNSDVNFDDDCNIANPPYPSYLWELPEARERGHIEAIERRQAVATWLSGVCGTIGGPL